MPWKIGLVLIIENWKIKKKIRMWKYNTISFLSIFQNFKKTLTYHSFLFDKPFDQLDEWGNHCGIANFFDYQNGQGRFVPGQPLWSWVLNGPVMQKTRIKLQILPRLARIISLVVNNIFHKLILIFTKKHWGILQKHIIMHNAFSYTILKKHFLWQITFIY